MSKSGNRFFFPALVIVLAIAFLRAVSEGRLPGFLRQLIDQLNDFQGAMRQGEAIGRIAARVRLTGLNQQADQVRTFLFVTRLWAAGSDEAKQAAAMADLDSLCAEFMARKPPERVLARECRANQGLWLMNMGREEKAETLLAEAYSLVPSAPGSSRRFHRCVVDYAQVLSASGKPKQAEAVVRENLDLSPASDWASRVYHLGLVDQLSSALCGQDRFAEAEKMLAERREWLLGHGGSPTEMAQMDAFTGVVAARAGQFRKALSVFERLATNEFSGVFEWYRAAVLAAHSRDDAAYRRLCRIGLLRFASVAEEQMAYWLASGLLSQPGDETVQSVAGAMVDRLSEAGDWSRDFLDLVRADRAQREHRPDEALALLDRYRADTRFGIGRARSRNNPNDLAKLAFFRALLCAELKKRGIKALLWHRFRRVLLPCLLGLVTVVPAMMWSSNFATVRRQEALQAAPASASIWVAIRKGDAEALRAHLQHGVSPDVLHPEYGTTLLAWAALTGQRECAAILLEKGAAIDRRNRDGNTALHAAACLGRAEIVQLLIAKGADVNATNYTGEVPIRSAAVDWRFLKYLASLLSIPLEQAEVEQGRARVVSLLVEAGAKDDAPTSGSPSDNTAGSAQRPLAKMINGLMEAPVLAHLWFLWILWWLVVVFAGVAAMARRLGWRIGGWFTPSYVNLLWLVPLTMLPVWFMDNALGGLGPDTSAGIIPRPRVFGYYAIFFFVGAFYYECDDTTGRLGRGWRWMLPVTLLVVFPVGLELSTGTFGLCNAWLPARYHRAVSVCAQALYAWLMIFGCMGMFRSLLVRENGTLRYLADSCYWLYLAHLPLVIVAQTLISERSLPWYIKMPVLSLALTGFLLLIYDKMIRYTWVGTMLNGRRTRPARTLPLPAASEGSPG